MACAKVGFRTKGEARRALTSCWRKMRPGRRLETRFYYCHKCGNYHLTSRGVA